MRSRLTDLAVYLVIFFGILACIVISIPWIVYWYFYAKVMTNRFLRERDARCTPPS